MTVDIIAFDEIAVTRASAIVRRRHLSGVRVVSGYGDPATSAHVTAVVTDSTAAWVVFIESSARLVSAFGDLVEHLAMSTADVVFADSIAPGGATVRRPAHSPERLRCQYFWGPVVAYRRSALQELGPLDDHAVGAELYDLALRATRAGLAVEHVDLVVCRESAAPLRATAHDPASIAAVLQRHLNETGGGEVRSTSGTPDGVHDSRRLVRGRPLVSIVIPTRATWTGEAAGRSSLLLNALETIHRLTTYEEYEVVVVADTGYAPDIIARATELLGERLTVVEWPRPFNFSDKVNLGVVHSRGEFVLMLNDDVEIRTPGWIEALLALAQLPTAGMVGAKLYFEDGTIQHAGHTYWHNDASHIGLDEPGEADGPLSGYRVEREVVGVTAACAMMPRRVFDEVGGLTGLLPGAFNDVDLCMKTTWRGWSIYWTPHAELTHLESKSRDATVHAYEVEVAWGRWGFRMHQPDYWPYSLTRPGGGS